MDSKSQGISSAKYAQSMGPVKGLFFLNSHSLLGGFDNKDICFCLYLGLSIGWSVCLSVHQSSEVFDNFHKLKN